MWLLVRDTPGRRALLPGLRVRKWLPCLPPRPVEHLEGACGAVAGQPKGVSQQEQTDSAENIPTETMFQFHVLKRAFFRNHQ